MSTPTVSRKPQILEAAARLFASRGYEGTSVRDIADAAGMLNGSLYSHYDSKESIFHEVIRRALVDATTELAEILASEPRAAERLRLAFRAYLRQSSNLGASIGRQWRSLTGQRRASVRRQREAYASLWQRIFEEGIASGELRAANPWLARVMAQGTVAWTVEWFRPDGSLPADEVADAFAAMLLTGLAAEKT